MNKKNIRLTNVKYMEPISQTKSNFVETQRLMLTSGNRPSTSSKHVHSNSNISNYLQKGNQIINEIFRNHSPQRGKSLYSLNKQTKIKKTNINNTSSYQITKTTPNSPNILVSKNKSYKNTNNNNNNNYHSHYIKAKKASIISNPNSALRSSTSSFSQGSKGNIHSNNLNQNKIKNKYTHTTKSRCGNSGLNSASHMSRDFLSAQLSPSSSSTSLSNLRQLYKETSSNNNNNNNNNNNSTVSKKQQRTPISCNKLRNVDQSGYINTTGVLTTNNNNNINQLSTKENSISVNNKVKTTIKTSLYTDYCSNTIKDIHDIETPEELHFFYVSVIQNGKLVEFKFESSDQTNQNNKS